MKLSIVTACLPSKDDFLPVTAESVRVAKLMAAEKNIEIEWILCYDGEMPVSTPDHADKIIALEHHCGVAVARNIALAHSTGKYFFPLDADDILVFEGIEKALEILSTEKHDWVAGNRVDLTDQITRHWHGKVSWPARFLAWDWTSPFPFHPSTIVMETDKALEVGGWPALPACEDVGFILEVSERFGGIAIPDVFARYRQWDKNTALTTGYLKEKDLAYKFIETLLNSNRRHRRDPLIERPVLSSDLLENSK